MVFKQLHFHAGIKEKMLLVILTYEPQGDTVKQK
jgi:hypothetical protein